MIFPSKSLYLELTLLRVAMTSFNLYKETKDHYDLLIPDKLEGLILLSLYEKFGKDEFSEDRINETIDKVHKDLGRQSQRNEYERNSAIVLKFQEFFLWRDDIKKTYRFKVYGEEFCEKIKERLESRYSPAEIKRLFDSLYHELLRHLNSPSLNFNLWVTEHFNRRTLDILTQVEILDQQVSESVKEFRKKIKENDQGLFQLLEEIEMSLDEIKEHASQLKDAFKATYDIEYKLEELLNSPESQQFISNINEVMNFNTLIRGQLEQVSDRIDRIKPRIREFIYEFNQRDFDRKTTLFLNLLLNNSKQIRNEKGKKILVLPTEVPTFSVFNAADLPRFVVIPEKDISPKIPVEVVYRKVNTMRQNDALKNVGQKIFERQRVQYWVKYIMEKLENEGQLNYTPLFFQILSEEGLILSIAVKTTNKIIRDLSKNRTYKITIVQEKEKHNLFPTINLWKMYIQKKFIS